MSKNIKLKRPGLQTINWQIKQQVELKICPSSLIQVWNINEIQSPFHISHKHNFIFRNLKKINI